MGCAVWRQVANLDTVACGIIFGIKKQPRHPAADGVVGKGCAGIGRVVWRWVPKLDTIARGIILGIKEQNAARGLVWLAWLQGMRGWDQACGPRGDNVAQLLGDGSNAGGGSSAVSTSV